MAVVIPTWLFEAGKWILAAISMLGIPSAVVALLFRRAEKKHDEERAAKKEAEEKREQERKAFELCVVQNTNAAIILAEATARAVQRIPDAKCNGDMTAALAYASEMKHKQKDMLAKMGVEHLYE